MKFTHVLKFNAAPEWKEQYLNYQLLKKIVYATSTAEAAEAGGRDGERRHLRERGRGCQNRV